MTQWTLGKSVHRILKWGECSLCWRVLRCVRRLEKQVNRNLTKHKKQHRFARGLHYLWTTIWSGAHCLGSSSTKQHPKVGCMVDTSQQCALGAKVANSILSSVSRSVTSRDSKVILPLHLDTPAALCSVLVFPLQYKSIFKQMYNIQFHHKGFCAKTK